MKTFRSIIAMLIVVALGYSLSAQNNIQYSRAYDQTGINVFEP